jgi:hypothetical protein
MENLKCGGMRGFCNPHIEKGEHCRARPRAESLSRRPWACRIWRIAAAWIAPPVQEAIGPPYHAPQNWREHRRVSTTGQTELLPMIIPNFESFGAFPAAWGTEKGRPRNELIFCGLFPRENGEEILDGKVFFYLNEGERRGRPRRDRGRIFVARSVSIAAPLLAGRGTECHRCGAPYFLRAGSLPAWAETPTAARGALAPRAGPAKPDAP